MDEESALHSLRNFYSKWGTGFLGRYDKLHAYGILSLLLLVSTVDMIVDWVNYAQLSAVDGFEYALVAGPPQTLAIHTLLFFNVCGTLFYVVECVNTLSIMCNRGHTKLAIELEQTLVILLEEIPLAAANLGIVVCRNDSGSAHQMACVLLALLNTALRLYFYNWVKEWRFKMEKTDLQSTVKSAIYAMTSGFWLMLFATACFTWSHEEAGDRKAMMMSAGKEQQSAAFFAGVSILLLKYPHFPYSPRQKFKNVTLDFDLQARR